MRDKIKEVNYSNAEITPRGKIFIQWVVMHMDDDDDRDLSVKEIMEEFNEYYRLLFNPQI